MTRTSTFLHAHGWEKAQQMPLAGDASSRQYIRLCSGPDRAILMIDPQDDTGRFAQIAAHLCRVGLSAPEIIAHAPGLMLLEDFGDAQFARIITEAPGLEPTLYRAATDVLVHLGAAHVPDGVQTATPVVLGQMIEPAIAHYIPAFGGTQERNAADLTARLTDLLETLVPRDTILLLRDYHAENMIWLPDRAGVRRVGLLDFQDALAGPPVYDLVSMLQDARRDVSRTCTDATLTYYLTRSGRAEQEVLPLFHLLGLQRNLRILGVFTRLAIENGKPNYLTLIPRVWGHIQTSLRAPASATLAPLIDSMFPEPTVSRLRKVQDLCQTP
ncbi:aminoglycoside phosphotransferase family protein [Marivita sp. S2033]|uniref:aminoglycoside phosphotransferase family protein n=1 Tax=Marivita sp. S2033 TaxID=3373187 RepID=UPI003981A815